MTRLRNELVLEKWKAGETASSHTGALCTNGRELVFIQFAEDWLSFTRSGANHFGGLHISRWRRFTQ